MHIDGRFQISYILMGGEDLSGVSSVRGDQIGGVQSRHLDSVRVHSHGGGVSACDGATRQCTFSVGVFVMTGWLIARMKLFPLEPEPNESGSERFDAGRHRLVLGF